MSQTVSTTDTPERVRFEEQRLGLFYLDPHDATDLADYLHRIDILAAGERVVSVRRAGEGNMNCTVRVTTSDRSFIVKQARPWVEKYPQFAAPWDRALREIEFYQLVSDNPRVAGCMPRLLAADTVSRLLVLEDLGPESDLTGIYGGATLGLATVEDLADYLSALHGGFPQPKDRPGLPNREMRALNHAHIFRIPLEPNNGLSLDTILPGLEATAAVVRADPAYVAAVDQLGDAAYLAPGECLVHGDFFPGSLLMTAIGPKVIDPEFAYSGRPEFDGGVFLAHLLLGHQPSVLAERFLERYVPPPRHDFETMLQLAGAEMMRRLIGYAQLPLGYGLPERKVLLELSRELVLRPDPCLLRTT